MNNITLGKYVPYDSFVHRLDPRFKIFAMILLMVSVFLRFASIQMNFIEEQSTYSSADFVKRLVKWYKRRGITVKCIQTDNGFEFTNRFSPSKRDKKTLFENTLSQLDIEHKLIRPYTPRHNGKVERSHREDHNKFYSCHRFYSCDDLNVQLAARLSRTNNRPMRPLKWFSPIEFLNNSVQYD